MLVLAVANSVATGMGATPRRAVWPLAAAGAVVTAAVVGALVVVLAGGSGGEVADDRFSGKSATTGVLKVLTMPPGAAVEVDGTDVGKPTPAVVERLKLGKHEVVVRFSGYEEETRKIMLDFGE